MKVNRKTFLSTLPAAFIAVIGFWGFWNPLQNRVHAAPAEAESSLPVPKYEIDPSWPKPFPGTQVTGSIGGICVDAKDHVFVANRQDIVEKETETATNAPPIMEFDSDGNMVNSWGDMKILPKQLHGCFVDYENNFWIGGSRDGIIQKYTHDGSKLLLQIGTKGVLDSSDGLDTGRALNTSKTGFYLPSGIAVDPTNGDIYVSDGYGNTRVAVFDKNGQFLRQWGHQGSAAETEAGVGGAFIKIVHCVVIDNSGLVYICDKQGDRVQVFDKMGNFKRNYMIEPRPHYPNTRPTLWGANSDVKFSADPQQKYMFTADEWRDRVAIFDRVTGKQLTTFGRPGHQLGEFDHVHTITVDSKNNVYVAETGTGRRVQKFRMVGTE